ncbi:hypothetical protein MESS2_1540042 [Mesorhizobium metallidurans STM 2683]|uniref:Uncharacterized protein n=1 Tax=Mesorhizobium metallidurans STM 2683 TaxID=1297569 RepID=M5EM53_9HYPH|nr:hypothetical protein MESS2_1540042 [Mesorhizobium metallidurans STM 2683]
MLITLYGKALESRLPHSLLRDHFADEAVRRIDYDFSRLKVDGNLGVGLAIRAKTLGPHSGLSRQKSRRHRAASWLRARYPHIPRRSATRGGVVRRRLPRSDRAQAQTLSIP